MAASPFTTPDMRHRLSPTRFTAVAAWVERLDAPEGDGLGGSRDTGLDRAQKLPPSSGYDNADSDTDEFDDRTRTKLLGVGIINYPDSDGSGEVIVTEETKELLEQLTSGQYWAPESCRQPGYIDRLLTQGLLATDASMRQHITSVLVPSVEKLYVDAGKFKYAAEGIDEPWGHCIPVTGETPKPAYTVGLLARAFTSDQYEKLGWIDTAKEPVRATEKVHYPFVACEIQCEDKGIWFAEIKGTHDAAVAVKSIQRLYELTFRTDDLHREIIFFTISHDASEVSIHAYVGNVKRSGVKVLRQLVLRQDIRNDESGPDKVYNAISHIYESFLPKHLERITSALEDLVVSRMGSDRQCSNAYSISSLSSDDESDDYNGDDDHDDSDENEEQGKQKKRATVPHKRSNSRSDGGRQTRQCQGLDS